MPIPKAGLKELITIVDIIKATPSRPQSCLALKRWLEEVGYEATTDCKHRTVYRNSGACTICGEIPGEEKKESSDHDALEKLVKMAPTLSAVSRVMADLPPGHMSHLHPSHWHASEGREATKDEFIDMTRKKGNQQAP